MDCSLTQEPVSMSATNLSCGDVSQVRNQALITDLHSESLLRVPLIRLAFCDLDFNLTCRAIDAHWVYEKLSPLTVSGFNPFCGAYFYGKRSCFARWLKNPFMSARDYNESDFLVKEALFMVHDYLHAWAYQLIHYLHPEKGILTDPVTVENFDDKVFCHLLTEAIATVGLDYWFLSKSSINSFCPIGTTIGPLTVNYYESRISEYRRFNPGLAVQDPAFLKQLSIFYCTGKFIGFSAKDLSKSPQLLFWLKHELKYGSVQRRLTRTWLAYVSPENIELDPTYLELPLSIDSSFRQSLLEELPEIVWNKVHGQSEIGFEGSWVREPAVHSAPKDRHLDYRFINILCTTPEDWKTLNDSSEENFDYFLYQFLSTIPYREVPKQILKQIPTIRSQRNLPMLLETLAAFSRWEVLPEEPRDLFTVN